MNAHARKAIPNFGGRPRCTAGCGDTVRFLVVSVAAKCHHALSSSLFTAGNPTKPMRTR